MAHQAGAYSGFCSMERLGLFLLPPSPTLDGMLIHLRVTQCVKLAATHLYTWVGRGTVRSEQSVSSILVELEFENVDFSAEEPLSNARTETGP